MATVIISLSDSLQDFVDAEVAAKGVGNVSAYVRSLLLEAQTKAHDARLEALLLEGLATGKIGLDAAFRELLATRAAQILDQPRGGVRS